MMVSKFRRQADNTYTRRVVIDGILHVFVIPSVKWNSRKVTSHVNYWIKRKRQGKSPMFKYGEVIEIKDVPELKCEKCDREYKTRYGLLRHIKNHHSNSVGSLIETPSPTEITTQKIENQTINQTNNIQNNITILPFGKENPKWITEKVIVDALRNIPGAIMNLVKEKHFNEKFPENRNVELCNEYRNRYLMVQEDTRKRIADREDMFIQMCNNACDAVTTTLESYSEPPDSDESEDEDELTEERRCRLVANRIRQSSHLSTVVDRYIDKWQDYVADVEPDEVLKKADHYITMLLLDLKLALAHEEDMLNIRKVSD